MLAYFAQVHRKHYPSGNTTNNQDSIIGSKTLKSESFKNEKYAV